MWKILARLNLLSCVLCSQAGDYLCGDCADFYLEPSRASPKLEGFSTVKVGFTFNAAVSELWKLGKHEGFRTVVEFLGEQLAEVVELPPSSVLVPVPLHPDKHRKRGFNQAEIIANQLAKANHHQNQSIRVLNLLDRIKNTKTQIGLNRSQRQSNLEEAFELNASAIREYFSYRSPSQIILIDDVLTTGTTLVQCRIAIEESISSQVSSVVFARR